ncbi:MAG: hypothetical protein ACRDD6_09100, partial [Tannerellaceae bacterium]
ANYSVFDVKDIGTERQIQFSIQTIPLPYSIPFLRDNNYITTYDDSVFVMFENETCGDATQRIR